MGKMTRKGGDLGRKGEGKLSFNRLFRRTRVLLRAALCRYRCPFFVAEQRKGERKSAKGCRLWKLLSCHATKRNKRDQIYFLCAVPQRLPTRVAGGGSKGFCPKVNANFFNSHSQALKLHIFASCCAERKRSAH